MKPITKKYDCKAVLKIVPPKSEWSNLVFLTLEPNTSPDVKVHIGEMDEAAHFHGVKKIEVQIYTYQIAELIVSLQKVIDKYGVGR